MEKKKIIITLLSIFILVFLAGNFIFSTYFNQGTDFIEEKIGIPIPKIGQNFRLGPDLQGGALLTYETIGLEYVEKHERKEIMTILRNVIHGRIERAGIIDPLIRIQDDRLVIEMAGVFDVKEAKRKIGKTPFLEFKELRPEEELQKIEDKIEEIKEKTGINLRQVDITPEILEKIKEVEGWEKALEVQWQSTGLTGKYLESAIAVFIHLEHVISVKFTGNGIPLLKEITRENLEKPLFIFLDGRLISAPIVRTTIRDGAAQISGHFTHEEASELAQNLNAGALPIRINIEPIFQQIIGPALGEAYLNYSLIAAAVGFLLVIIFLILFYKLAGLMAAISLISYAILILFIFNIFGITLTLAGFAGIILSVGMAVDANILIFSRIKEEIKESDNLEKVIDYGIKRAWPSIRDGNLTTLIIVFLLYFSGISFLQSFALGLGVGIIISVFTAIIITQSLLKLFIGTRIKKSKLLI